MKESLDEQSRKDLINYRIERAEETIKEADLREDISIYIADQYEEGPMIEV